MTPHSLTDAILDLWPVWAAHENEDEAVYEHLQDHRFALIDAADALPATREAIVPKALAGAWLEYVDSYRRGCPRNGYSTDGRLAVDIHAAVVGSEPQPSTGRPTAPAKPQVTVVVTVDFASASIGTLRSIAHTMEHLADAAHSLMPHSDDDWLPVGYLMVSLGEGFDAVKDGAEAELQRRQPTDFEERRLKLAAVADRIIHNGDDAETAAFVQDLAAWAAEQARR